MCWDWENQNYSCDILNYESENLVGKDFSYQCLVEVNFRNAILEKANFKCSNFRDAQFQRAILERANFKNAILRGAKFEGANLKDANLQGADLHEASFSGANIQGANLKNCTDIITAKFEGTLYDEKTQFPEDFNPLDNELVKKVIRVSCKDETHESKAGVKEQDNITKSINKIKNSMQARRGQKKFRNSLIANYKNRCAITGIEIPGLEAAHIKPYSVCEEEEKIDPKNGLLLRADIHILFDFDLIYIQPNYIVKVREPLLSSRCKNYTESINDKELRSVKNGIFKPDDKYLKWRYDNYDKNIGVHLRKEFKITNSNNSSKNSIEELLEALNNLRVSLRRISKY